MNIQKKRFKVSINTRDRYVAKLWDYTQYSRDVDKDKRKNKTADGVYTVHVLRTIAIYQEKKYTETINALALKTNNKVAELISIAKADLHENLAQLKTRFSDNPINIEMLDGEEFELALPNSTKSNIILISTELLGLFDIASNICQELNGLTELELIKKNKFRNLRFDLLRPLRITMNDISAISKRFHRVRKQKLS